MLITIDFDAKIKEQLDLLAEQEGIDAPSLIKRFVVERLPNSQPEPHQVNEKAIALLRSWREEDVTADVDELKRPDKETESFLADIEANRFNIPSIKPDVN